MQAKLACWLTLFSIPALHAAIIAINDCLEQDDPVRTSEALANSAACLSGVDQANAAKYHIVLANHKREKVISVETRRNPKVHFS